MRFYVVAVAAVPAVYAVIVLVVEVGLVLVLSSTDLIATTNLPAREYLINL